MKRSRLPKSMKHGKASRLPKIDWEELHESDIKITGYSEKAHRDYTSASLTVVIKGQSFNVSGVWDMGGFTAQRSRPAIPSDALDTISQIVTDDPTYKGWREWSV